MDFIDRAGGPHLGKRFARIFGPGSRRRGCALSPSFSYSETIAQAGILMVLAQAEDRAGRNTLFAGIESVKFRRIVRPGERMVITASLLVFAFAIQPLGVVIAIALLTLVGSFAGREGRPLEIAATTVILIAITLVIFVWGVGLPIPVWPEL